MRRFPTEDAARKVADRFTKSHAGLYRYDVVMNPQSAYVIAIIRTSDETHLGFLPDAPTADDRATADAIADYERNNGL